MSSFVAPEPAKFLTRPPIPFDSQSFGGGKSSATFSRISTLCRPVYSWHDCTCFFLPLNFFRNLSSQSLPPCPCPYCTPPHPSTPPPLHPSTPPPLHPAGSRSCRCPVRLCVSCWCRSLLADCGSSVVLRLMMSVGCASGKQTCLP